MAGSYISRCLPAFIRRHCQYQGQADPGGKLPHFIADKVALKATFTTFNRLPQVLMQYQQPYPGISTP